MYLCALWSLVTPVIKFISLQNVSLTQLQHRRSRYYSVFNTFIAWCVPEVCLKRRPRINKWANLFYCRYTKLFYYYLIILVYTVEYNLKGSLSCLYSRLLCAIFINLSKVITLPPKCILLREFDFVIPNDVSRKEIPNAPSVKAPKLYPIWCSVFQSREKRRHILTIMRG